MTIYLIVNEANGNQVVDLGQIEDCPFPHSTWTNQDVAFQALKWARTNLLLPDNEQSYKMYMAYPLNV